MLMTTALLATVAVGFTPATGVRVGVMEWRERQPIGLIPPPEWQPAMTYDALRERVILVLTGTDANGVQDEEMTTWAWDGTSWTVVNTQHRPPAMGNVS